MDGAGTSAEGPATNAPASWYTTSSPLRQTNSAEPTRNEYHRPSNGPTPLAGSAYLVR